jgi:hypothetical protein
VLGASENRAERYGIIEMPIACLILSLVTLSTVRDLSIKDGGSVFDGLGDFLVAFLLPSFFQLFPELFPFRLS